MCQNPRLITRQTDEFCWHITYESERHMAQRQPDPDGKPPLKHSSRSEDSYDSFLSALAIPDAFAVRKPRFRCHPRLSICSR